MSSTSAAPIPAERFNAMTDPASLRDGFKPTGTRYALAARLTGPGGFGISARRAGGPKAGGGSADRASCPSRRRPPIS